MKIQVLGSGCTTCKKLYEAVQQAVAGMDEDISLDYITGTQGTMKIIELGAMTSPVLVVDNQIALTGFTSDIAKITASIRQFV